LDYKDDYELISFTDKIFIHKNQYIVFLLIIYPYIVRYKKYGILDV